MSRTRDMTVGNITRQMVLFALPIILTNIGQQFYMIVDAAIVGRGVGVKALASVGSADWIYWLVLWTAGAFTTAFSTFVARSFGEKDFKKLNKTLAMSILLSALLGLILTVSGLLASRPVLELLKTPSDIIDGAEIYLITMISGTMIVVAYNLAAAILRAFGDAKSPMIAMAISAVINIGLDILFVLAFHWGIFGAAFASILSQLVSFIYCYFCIKKIEYVNIEKTMWKPDWSMIRELTVFAIPVSFETIVISLGGIILQATINAQGSVFVAGYTAVNKLYGLLECTAVSLGFTFLTFFAQNYGAKEYDRVRRGLKSSILISIIAASIVSCIVFIFGRQLIGIFLDGSMEGALEAIEVAWRYLRFMAICMSILYLIYPYRKVLQGMGNAVWSMFSGSVECVIRVGMGWLVAAGLSAEILYYIEPSAWLGALLFVAIPYYIIKEDYLK